MKIIKTFQISEEKAEELREKAFERRVSQSEAIRRGINLYLEKENE